MSLILERFAGAAWPLYEVHLTDLVGLTQLHEVLWTIPVEVQFYLAFPVLWIVYRRSRPMLIIAALALIAVAETTPIYTDSVRGFYAIFFLAGLLVALAPPPPRGANGIFCVCLIAYFVGYPKILQELGLATLHLDDLRYYPWREPSYLFLIPLLLWSAIHSSIADRIFGNPVHRAWGTSPTRSICCICRFCGR